MSKKTTITTPAAISEATGLSGGTDDMSVRELLSHITAINQAVALATTTLDPEYRIVVMSDDFVFYGLFWVENGWFHIDKPFNIRVWGTTKGLGELVHGPTSSTKLDENADITAPIHSLVWSMPVADPNQWPKHSTSR